MNFGETTKIGRANQLIIDNALGVLVNLLNEDTGSYDNKEFNRKDLCELFGDDVFTVCKGLSKADFCRYIGIDRSAIRKAYDGTVKGKSGKLAEILKDNGLLDKDKRDKFRDGEISVKITDNKEEKKLNKAIEKCLNIRSEEDDQENRDSDKDIRGKKKPRRDQDNNVIQDYIKNYIKKYIEQKGQGEFNLNKGTQSYELSDTKSENYLDDDWLILFFKWVVKTTRNKRNKNKSILDELDRFEFKKFEKLNDEDLDQAVERIHSIYLDVWALQRIRKKKR